MHLAVVDCLHVIRDIDTMLCLWKISLLISMWALMQPKVHLTCAYIYIYIYIYMSGS